MSITYYMLLSSPEYEVILCFQSTTTQKRIDGNDETHTSINLHEVMPHMQEREAQLREFRTIPSAGGQSLS